MTEGDDTRAEMLAEQLRESEAARERAEQELLALRTSPEYQVGQLTSLARKVGVVDRDVDGLWSRYRQTAESVEAIRLSVAQLLGVVQSLGSTLVREHETTRGMIVKLPCHPGEGGGGNGSACPVSDTERPPSLHVVGP